MAINANRRWDAERMCYEGEYTKKFRQVKLKEATEEELSEFHLHNVKLRLEHDEIRPSVYMTHGTFSSNPLLEDFRYFLLNKDIKYIVVED